ncbi:uncharacterized protein LOC110604840 [Manihot esculenta]|uniref:Uncharacterized protein n=1 Tax=Manihot esculenta TaxID=3983 RepID=A0A2C9WES1_MANES|nr:uncharacterized protein LOC110604840 [Manihot esculenta]OAY58371.1 hypothetical protein MANES_02G172300v8 [Manihot esculenta]
MLHPSSKFPQSNHLHFSTHASGRITDGFAVTNHGFRAHKPPQNYANYQPWNSSPGFGPERKLIDDDGSGVVSPPLWRTSPPRSPQDRQSHYRSLSPSSRTQAIARGQRELMDMVSQMPEGCYELSLKDIVEQNMVDQAKEESFSKERSKNVEGMYIRERSEKKKNDKPVQINRSGSIDKGGFLLKMVFPISWGSRNKKKKNNNIYNNKSGLKNSAKDGRVSPKPLLLDGSAKGGENEWWKNRFSESCESENGGFSSNSGSSKSSGSSSSRSSSRNGSTRHGGGGCWSSIFGRRRKKQNKG